jgi:hypothetical protein
MSQMPARAREADEYVSFIKTPRRVKTGMGALVKSVLGGNSALGDAEIKAAVEPMVGQGK